MSKAKKGNPNSWINRKVIEGTLKLQELATKAAPRIADMSVKKQCQGVLAAIKVMGVAHMRQAVLSGYDTEWAGKSKEEIAAEMAELRAEPLFEKVMKKLQFSWADLEKMTEVV